MFYLYILIFYYNIMRWKLLIFTDLSLNWPGKDLFNNYKKYTWLTFSDTLIKIAKDFDVMNEEYDHSINSHHKFFDEYNIESTPTFVVVDSNNNEVDRHIGTNCIYSYLCEVVLSKKLI